MTMTSGGLAKLIEETGELQQVAGKKLAYFHTDDHPDGQGSLKERMEDEIADVIAIIEFVVCYFGLNRSRIDVRIQSKLAQFDKWHNDPNEP